MNKFIDMFKQLPAGFRFLIGWCCVCMPLMLLKPLLPDKLYAPLISGVTAFFLVFYVIRLLINLYEKKQGKALDSEITTQQAGPSRIELAEKEKEYKQKWLEGIEKLTKAKISLYQLPWYIIIGEPGGGKTMTLLNSGMDFPMGKEELSGFGGTRNYNWWFTNAAVILDTAGRLIFEQEGTSDRAEWETFLKLLKRRRRCPINGVIVALPADKLLSDDAEQRYTSSCIIRDRLRQVQTLLGLRFPVFFLITKSDLVAGFTEFYNELDSLQRNQLFGWSRPGDFSEPYEPGDFAQHFEELYERLNELRLQFLARKTSDTELGWVYTYPEAFHILKDRIQDYIDVIFSKNIFAESLFFRGFYFTSALQEGKPIIDVLGEHLSGEELDNLEGIFPQSRAFFIHDFYTGKVAKEQGMVFRSQKHIKRMRLLKNSTFFVGLPMLILFVAVTVWGYRDYTKNVETPLMEIVRQSDAVLELKESQNKGEVWFESIDREKDFKSISDAVGLVDALDVNIGKVKNPTGPASIMFASLGEDVEGKIRSIQRELIGYYVLRPEVARVEQALVKDVPITPDNARDFASSLITYIDWYFGGKSDSLNELRSILPDKSFIVAESQKQLKTISEGGGGIRLSAGMTSNREHQQQIITAALERARDYWMTTAKIDEHPSYEWWATLISKCNQAKEKYTALLEFRRNFEQARQRKAFTDLAQSWLDTLARSDEEESLSGTGAGGKLLQSIQFHMRRAPRDGSLVKLIGTIAEENHKKAVAFWQDVKRAIPDPEQSSSDATHARRWVEMVDDIPSTLRMHLNDAVSNYEQQIIRLDKEILGPYPSGAPKKYDYTRSALAVEKKLDELANILRDVSTSPEPYLDSWNERLHALMEDQGQQDDADYDLEPPWQSASLKKLTRSVNKAHRRYELQVLIEEISENLDPAPDIGLAKFMDGHDDPARVLQFPDLKNRHASSFMINTVRAQQAMQATLEMAVEKGILVDSAEPSRLLQRGLQQYLQHYLDSWIETYDNYRLDEVADFVIPDNWDDYRRYMRESATEVWRDYEDHIDVVLRNVPGLFQISPTARGATAIAKRKLQEHLEEVYWPNNSKLKTLFDAFAGQEELPNTKQLQRSWRNYKNHVEEFRFEKLTDLKRKPVIFPAISQTRDLPEAFQTERLTAQLQHVIDAGQWLLWADVFNKLEEELQDAFAAGKPFIFHDGSFEVDSLQLRKFLDTTSLIKGFHDKQVRRKTSTEAASQAVEQQKTFLASIDLWRTFLRQDGFPIELSYLPASQLPEGNLLGPEKYYSEVALKMPGLRAGEGKSRDEWRFSASKASEVRGYRWVPPTKGTIEISLWGVTGTSNQLGAAVMPRIVTLPAQYGLLELIRKYGRKDDDGAWIVRLSKDLTQISGLQDEATDNPQRWMAFRIKFNEPKSGLPDPISWPDFQALAGSPPALP